MAPFINQDGAFIEAAGIKISPDNRSFRYGDGCFETIKVVSGQIVLASYHFERLFRSLEILQFDMPGHFSIPYFTSLIRELVLINAHSHLARIRFTFYRGEGGLHEVNDNFPHFIIQSWPANAEANQWNADGVSTKIFESARIAPDVFSPIKSNNYLPYVMGALSAKSHSVDDCILLNAFDRICDATIANVFIVQKGTIVTPPISEGPVAGVMRKYLLQQLHDADFPAAERPISVDELLQANEVFLTNAMFGIKWVKQVNESSFTCELSRFLFDKFITPLWLV